MIEVYWSKKISRGPGGPGWLKIKWAGPGRAGPIQEFHVGRAGRAVSKLNGPGRAGPTVLDVGPRARLGAHLDVPGLNLFHSYF